LLLAAVSTLLGCSAYALPATLPGAEGNPLRIISTSSVLPLVREAAAIYDQAALSIEIRAGDYRQGLEALRRGEAHLMVTAHLESRDASSLWAAPMGQDALVVITHPDNPVDRLTLSQVRAVFQGLHGDWSRLGGDIRPLTVVSRPENADTRLLFEQQVMGRRLITNAAVSASSESAVLETVRATPGAVGVMLLSSVNDSVKVLAIEGVMPTAQSVRDGRYPLRATLYALSLTEPEDLSREFIGWLQSPAGQQAIHGHLPPLVAVPKSP
jgi:phosphate transport system substrate-binding protein